MKMILLLASMTIALGCGGKPSGPSDADKKTCASTDEQFIQLAAKGGSPAQIDTLLIAGFTACARACDAKDKPSCDVLGTKGMTWSSSAGATMQSLDKLCDSSKSPSLKTNLCDAIIASRHK